MKVLVTGGAGYIGSHAVFLLIEKGYEVIIVDNLSKGFLSNLHPQAKFYKGDIRDEKLIRKIFLEEKNIESIMHFAGLIIVPESVKKPIEYFDNNTNGVMVLLNVAKDFDVKTFIFSSTAAVYGEPKKLPILENDEKSPINPYGDSKLAAESLIKNWAKAYNRNYVIFRYFNVAGAHPSGKIGVKGEALTHLLPLVINSAINQEITFQVMGTDYDTKDGSCIRDFVHVDDLVLSHVLGMEWSLKNKKSDIFNLGSGGGYSVLEVLNSAQKFLNINIPNKQSPRRMGDPAKLFADTTKAKKILNWTPSKNLQEIILSEYNFRKNN
ncbi:MAG: UDP-glucose 4-epimerase GalE [Metamycoplasmataceae bacterium]